MCKKNMAEYTPQPGLAPEAQYQLYTEISSVTYQIEKEW